MRIWGSGTSRGRLPRTSGGLTSWAGAAALVFDAGAAGAGGVAAGISGSPNGCGDGLICARLCRIVHLFGVNLGLEGEDTAIDGFELGGGGGERLHWFGLRVGSHGDYFEGGAEAQGW